MKRPLLSLALPASFACAADVEVLIHLGLGDAESTVWDGSVSVMPGEVQLVEGYRFEQKDAYSSPSFTMTVRQNGCDVPACTC